MKETAMQEDVATAGVSEHQRLRAMALRLIGQANRFFVMDFLEDAVAALGGQPDPAAWRSHGRVTDASDGQWFYWRDPSGDAGKVHVDQVGVHHGRIAVKQGGGLMDDTECQPCRFAPDVTEALARLAARGYAEWG